MSIKLIFLHGAVTTIESDMHPTLFILVVNLYYFCWFIYNNLLHLVLPILHMVTFLHNDCNEQSAQI